MTTDLIALDDDALALACGGWDDGGGGGWEWGADNDDGGDYETFTIHTIECADDFCDTVC